MLTRSGLGGWNDMYDDYDDFDDYEDQYRGGYRSTRARAGDWEERGHSGTRDRRNRGRYYGPDDEDDFRGFLGERHRDRGGLFDIPYDDRRSRRRRERDRPRREFDVMEDFHRMGFGGDTRRARNDRGKQTRGRDEFEDVEPGELDLYMSGALPDSRPHTPVFIHDPSIYFGTSRRFPEPADNDTRGANHLRPGWYDDTPFDDGNRRPTRRRRERRGDDGGGGRFGTSLGFSSEMDYLTR